MQTGAVDTLALFPNGLAQISNENIATVTVEKYGLDKVVQSENLRLSPGDLQWPAIAIVVKHKDGRYTKQNDAQGKHDKESR